ncbi:MAG: hypothetical protein KGN34_15455 [Sphingomonadales bacterium]|nr:hypothetical protein [Sphingomonadales bacterium]
MSLLLSFVLLQSGSLGAPMVSPGAAPAIMQPPLRDEHTRRRHNNAPTEIVAPEPGRLGQCLRAAESDAAGAEATARGWLKDAIGSEQAGPLLCLGSAQAAQDNWSEAEKSFLAGRDMAAASDHGLRARLGAMAGNAALAQGAPDRALAVLDTARKDAEVDSDDPHLVGDIAVDRARALVGLKRLDEAFAALVEARTGSPNNAQAWLLSATLSRRQGKLAQAQAQIQTAAELLPTDPDIGLEAGVIAVLAGHDDAARKSWQSVLAAAPDSAQAGTAKAYLAQLGPAPMAKPAAVPATGK